MSEIEVDNKAICDPTRHFYASKDLLIAAVDFDGTLVESDYPKIGKQKVPYWNVIRKLKAEGWYIILWTCRSGQELIDAVNYCLEHQIPIDRVNSHHPDMMKAFNGKHSPKIHADVYIDDKNVMGLAPAEKIFEYCEELKKAIQNQK